MHTAPLTLDDTTSWANLLAICFERPPADMEKSLAWLHRLGDVIAWGSWHNDQLVAQYTCLIRNVHVDGDVLRVGMSINMAVHPDFRGRGLVKHMAQPVYEQVRERGGVLGLGFSNAQGVKVDRHSKGYGYCVVGQLQPVIGFPRPSHEPALTLTDTLPNDFAPIDSPTDGYRFCKTPHDLRSRYANHPFRRYQYGLWVEGNTICGVVVYRRVCIAGAALLDACGHDLPVLLARWAATVRRDGTAFVHLLSTPNSDVRQALAAVMPLITQPYTRSPHYLTLKPLTDAPMDSLTDFDHWHFTGGDIL